MKREHTQIRDLSLLYVLHTKFMELLFLLFYNCILKRHANKSSHLISIPGPKFCTRKIFNIKFFPHHLSLIIEDFCTRSYWHIYMACLIHRALDSHKSLTKLLKMHHFIFRILFLQRIKCISALSCLLGMLVIVE